MDNKHLESLKNFSEIDTSVYLTATQTMNKLHNEYMDARNTLNDALAKFLNVSRKVGFEEYKIASDVVDAIYDTNDSLFAYAQRSLLPMVDSFKGSRSTVSTEVLKDWDKVITEWEQRKMWRALNG